MFKAVISILSVLLLVACGQNPESEGGSSEAPAPAASNAPPKLSVDQSVIHLSGSDRFISVAVFSDPDGDVVSLTLSGEDANQFIIDAENFLRFGSVPRFNAPRDLDRDNGYRVTVEASDGKDQVSREVIVEVVDAIRGLVIGKQGPRANVVYDQNFDGVVNDTLQPAIADGEGRFNARRDQAAKNQKQVAFVLPDATAANDNSSAITLLTRVPADPAIEAVRISPLSTLIYSVTDPKLKTEVLAPLGLRLRRGDEPGDPYWEEFFPMEVSQQQLEVMNAQLDNLMTVSAALFTATAADLQVTTEG